MTGSPLKQALERVGQRKAEFESLSIEALGQTPAVQVSSWPTPPAARRTPRGRARDVPFQPELSPDEVAARWNQEGVAFLAAASRRELSAVSASLEHPLLGPVLAQDVRLARTLLRRLRRSRSRRALERLFFAQHPPGAHIWAELDRIRADTPEERHPVWWAKVDSRRVDLLVSAIAGGITSSGWPVVARDFDLPDAARRGGWARAVAQRARPYDVDAVTRLFDYLSDAPGGAMTEAHQAIARSAVELGSRMVSVRPELAALLRRRVGDPFSASGEAQWRGLEDERRKIRSWVAHEVLDVLFGHLVPSNEFKEQTPARRRFWIKYTAHVDKIWLLIHPGLSARLRAQEVRKTLDRVGSMVEVRELEGADQQAIVWMTLIGRTGKPVTVVEGNANASFRLRPGQHEPPSRGRSRVRSVDYSRHIVNGTFYKEHADCVVFRHSGHWEGRVQKALRDHGVVP